MPPNFEATGDQIAVEEAGPLSVPSIGVTFVGVSLQLLKKGWVPVESAKAEAQRTRQDN